MGPEVSAAVIGAAAGTLAAALTTIFTVWVSHRQRAVDLVVAALSHMGGGSQARSAGVAALTAMRGPLKLPLKRSRQREWALYGPAVGQQLFRQLMYVLNHGENRFVTHEVETVIAMTTWIIEDNTLDFRDQEQRSRLSSSIGRYVRAAPRPHRESLAALVARSAAWREELDPPR